MALSDRSNTYLGPEGILGKKNEYLLPCSFHFYKNPPQLVKGKGTRLWDHNDKEYIDFFGGVSVMSCGHCNDDINEEVINQIQQLQHTTSIYLTEPVVNLAEELSHVLPGSIKRSFFCNSGSEANDGAMTLARMYTGKEAFVALKGSLHGRTYLTSGITEIPMWRTDPFLNHLPMYFVENRKELEEVLEEHSQSIAGFIFEPIQGNGGIKTLEHSFISELIPLLHKHKVLAIADEIQTGFGRTGYMFASEHYGIIPDIITGAKALGNGFPIGFFATTDGIGHCFTKPSASTLGGNPVSATAGLAVLKYIKKENLTNKAKELGQYLKARLTTLASEYQWIKEVRGFGLMLGVEIQHEQAPEVTDLILESMKDKGFLIGKNGLNRNVLAFQPPLVITKKEIDMMLTSLNETFKEIL
ncbi:aspartate aminotransferase family protein [Spirochaeta cellobiosiphila]|uniref:aspartate aminotransferase family protein n=1 Tax=Spirochaeta cellobiosiphila TaxID=504483 RepID=UPI000406CF93|nr:aspartate aminotransferase family protein [Spirochaeta cellobiosiphila]